MLRPTDGGADAQDSFRRILDSLDPPLELPELKPTKTTSL
jgi:hypothetical protein